VGNLQEEMIKKQGESCQNKEKLGMVGMSKIPAVGRNRRILS
jgi:hypothetical protein